MDDQASGAYIFRPANSAVNQSIPYTSLSSAQVYQGKVITQVTLSSDDAIVNMKFENKQSSTPGVELEAFVNSINVGDNIGKEVVLIVESSEINNNQTWYTDSNGLDMQQRIYNFRPTWNLSSVQPASGNYYPVTSAIYIQDVTSGLRST